MSQPPELNTIYLIFAFIALLLFVAVLVLSLICARLTGEKISLLTLPSLLVKGLKVWMGVALDDNDKDPKSRTIK